MARDALHGGEGQGWGDTTLRLSGCRQRRSGAPEPAIQYLTHTDILRTDLNNGWGTVA